MKILLFNFNNILTDVAEELVKRGHELVDIKYAGDMKAWKKADVIVVWNETELAGWRHYITKMKKLKKRVVLVQHGRRGTSRIYPPFNETLISDAVCVWSENDKQRLMSVGVEEGKIHVTGTPLFKHLKPRVPNKVKTVVFSPEHWDVDVVENLIVADKLRQLKGVNIVTKILKDHQNPVLYDNPIASDRNSLDHMGIVAEVLSKADLVVGISESTFELLAESLDIPVVIADCWIPKACDGDDRYKEYHREYSPACAMAKLDKLSETIVLHLKKPELLHNARKDIIIKDGGFDIEDPVSKIINVITNN